MRMYLISDNIDTSTGMRLAGVDGIVVHEKDEVNKELDRILEERDIGVVLMTEKISDLIPERIIDIKLNYSIPLIVTIPDRHGSHQGGEMITKYVREAIGLRI